MTARSIEVFDEVVCLGRTATCQTDRYDTTQYIATINIVVRKKEDSNKKQTTEEVLKRWKRRDNDNTIDQKIFTFNKDFVIL